MSVPSRVLDAFGLDGEVEPLPGGEGRSVRVGGAVLKPMYNREETTCAADLLAGVEEAGFRLPRPLRAMDGNWTVDGWCANRLVEGVTGPAGRWEELLAAARAFHLALRSVPRPDFLGRRNHRWELADQVAWGEGTFEPVPEVVPLLTRLQALARPVEAQCQLVHGDLSGNLLFADGLPPAIIDLSPYWRPAAYADAIVAVDGLLWFGADRDLLGLADGGRDFPQMLVRAVIFRLVALSEQARTFGPGCLDELTQFTRVVAEVERVDRGSI